MEGTLLNEAAELIATQKPADRAIYELIAIKKELLCRPYNVKNKIEAIVVRLSRLDINEGPTLGGWERIRKKLTAFQKRGLL